MTWGETFSALGEVFKGMWFLIDMLMIKSMPNPLGIVLWLSVISSIIIPLMRKFVFRRRSRQ